MKNRSESTVSLLVVDVVEVLSIFFGFFIIITLILWLAVLFDGSVGWSNLFRFGTCLVFQSFTGGQVFFIGLTFTLVKRADIRYRALNLAQVFSFFLCTLLFGPNDRVAADISTVDERDIALAWGRGQGSTMGQEARHVQNVHDGEANPHD